MTTNLAKFFSKIGIGENIFFSCFYCVDLYSKPKKIIKMENPNSKPSTEEVAKFKNLQQQCIDANAAFIKSQNNLFAAGDGFFSKHLLDDLEKTKKDVENANSEFYKFLAFMRSKYFRD